MKSTVISPETVLSSIEAGNIALALNQILDYLKSAGRTEYIPDAEGWLNSYKYMLQYALTGNEDPGRSTMENEVKMNLIGLCRELIADRDSVSNPNIFYATRRLERLQKNSLENLIQSYLRSEKEYFDAIDKETYTESLALNRENLLDNIFEHIMALPFDAAKELKLVMKLTADNIESEDLALVAVSALFISLTQLYDRHKLMTLIDIYDNSPSERLQARAMVGIIIVLDKYKKEISDDLAIRRRLELWQDSLINYTRLRDAVMEFLRTIDTSRVNDKMKKDFIPTMQKLRPEILKNMQEMYGKGDLEDLEFNPEWEEMLRESGLEKKMREFAEMQSEGADLMMMAFSNLKAFPFFNKLPHWFITYSPYHSQLTFMRRPDNGAFRKLLSVKASPFCETDKFSFALSLNQIPDAQKKMISSQISAGMEQLQIEENDNTLRDPNPAFNSEMKKYLRDLYRFFFLFRMKDQFQNPLAAPLNYIELPILGEWLNDVELNSLASEFFFNRGYYKEALLLFEDMTGDSETEGHIWEKIGFCLQSLGNPADAIKAYRNAEFFFPEKTWLHKMMAFCLKAIGNYEEAAVYYKKVLDSDSENVKSLYNCALALIAARQYKEALDYCYKAVYLDEGNKRMRQLCALAEVLAGNLEKGKQLIDRLMIEFGFDSSNDNYLLMLVYNLVNRNLSEANKYYRMLGDTPSPRFATAEKEFKFLGIYNQFAADLITFREISYL